VKSNQDGSEETRIDELDFFGTPAQSYGNRRGSDLFQALNGDSTVQLVISVACGNRKDCSQEIVRSQWGNLDPISPVLATCKVALACAKTTIVSALGLTYRSLYMAHLFPFASFTGEVLSVHLPCYSSRRSQRGTFTKKSNSSHKLPISHLG